MFHCYYHPTGIVLIEEVEDSILDIDILMPILWEWLEFSLRWLHVITAISWIGTSFYFIALDLGLRRNKNAEEGIAGEEWQVHGGGFYNIKKYIKQSSKRNVKKISLKSLWVVRQFKNEYNPIHFHSGNISGVGYLKIPKNITKSKKRLKTNGTIDFIHGSKSFLSDSLFNHNPKVGDMILFPNNLMHTAYPFKREGERRSFSFNVDIDKKTFDIFNG